MGQTIDCLCKGIEFAQSHWPEEAIPNLSVNLACVPDHTRKCIHFRMWSGEQASVNQA